MAVRRFTALLFATFMVTVGFSVVATLPADAQGAVKGASPAVAAAAGVGGAVRFEENRGQVDEEVRFVAHDGNMTVFFTPTEVVMVPLPPATANAPTGMPGDSKERRDAYCNECKSAVIRMSFIGANDEPTITGSQPLAGRSNYFLGNDSAKWATDVPSFGRIKYTQVYPGIDLVFYGTPTGQIEHDFIVAPGSDPKLIRMSITGAKLSIGSGALVLATDTGNLTFDAPKLHQTILGKKASVDGRFVLAGETGVRFEIGAYDLREELVIDPVLSWSTYLGGGPSDIAYDVVESKGEVYVAGTVRHLSFPKLSPLPQSQWVFADGDAFVAKFTSGGALVYSAQFGGNERPWECGYEVYHDVALGLGVDAFGAAYVTGFVNSDDFPLVNSFQSSKGLRQSAFVAKLNPAGNALVYSTYFGGAGSDAALGLDVTPDGYAYITGYTEATALFPLVNAVQTTNQGILEAFVAKMSQAGNNVEYSTYLGGDGLDIGRAIAVDGKGDAYVTGSTASAGVPFPTEKPYQSALAGPTDAFVTKLHFAGGSLSLAYSTYLGGAAGDEGLGIDLDPSGAAYLTGATGSTDFPTSLNPDQSQKGGGVDAFITKLEFDSTTLSLGYSTYFGGPGTEIGRAITTITGRNVYVTGETWSTTNFPLLFPTQSNYAGPNSEVFVAAYGASGARGFSTLLGGGWFQNGYWANTQGDIGHGIAMDAACNVYVTGMGDYAFPLTATSQFQTGLGYAFLTAYADLGNSEMAGPLCRANECDTDGNMVVDVGAPPQCFEQKPATPTCTGNGSQFVLKFETGAATFGTPDPVGQADIHWRVESAPAPIVTPRLAESIDDHPTWAASLSSNYVNALDDLSDPLNQQPGGSVLAPLGVYVYAFDFYLPVGATNIFLDLKHSADDSVVISLNGISPPFATGASPNLVPQTANGQVSNQPDFVFGGVNTVRAAVTNTQGVTGIAVVGEISGKCPVAIDPCDTDGDGITDVGAPPQCFPPPPSPPCVDGAASFVLTFGTGSANGMVEDPFGQTDAHWRVESAPAPIGGPGPAESIGADASWVADGAIRNWINALDDSTDPLNAQPGGSSLAPGGDYVYAYDFTLPAGATNLLLSLKHAADDSAAIALNNNPAFVTSSNPSSGVGGSTTTGFLTSGVNTLRATVTNNGGMTSPGGITGFFAEGQISGDCSLQKAPAQRPLDEIATRIDASGVWTLLDGALSVGAIQERLPSNVRLDVTITRKGLTDLTFTATIEGGKVLDIQSPAAPGSAKYTLSTSEPAALSILNAFERGRTAGLLYAGGFLAVNGESQVDKIALKGASSDLGASFLKAAPYAVGSMVTYDGISAPLAAGDGVFLAKFGPKAFLVDAHGGRVGYAATNPDTPIVRDGATLSLDLRSGATTNSKEARTEFVRSDPLLNKASTALRLVLNGGAGSDSFLLAADSVRGSGKSAPSSALPCVADTGDSPTIFDRWGNMRSSGFALGAASTETVKAKMCPAGTVTVRPIDDPPGTMFKAVCDRRGGTWKKGSDGEWGCYMPTVAAVPTNGGVS